MSAFIAVSASGQLFYNNGQTIVVNSGPDGILFVNDNSLQNDGQGYIRNEGLIWVEQDLVNTDGQIDNAGLIDVDRNLQNDDTLTGYNSGSGTFRVFQHWINNDNFRADQSTVELDGNNQFITGSVSSRFYNLDCFGTGIKTLQLVDAYATNRLDLTSIELATDIHTMHVTNTNPNAILRTTGFVSSLGAGRLNRSTNSNSNYLFPTGSSLGTFRYRPIVIRPDNSNPQVYGARLANTDANNEFFDRSIREDIICAINPYYYHRLYGTSSGDIRMFFDPVNDGNWTDMAHWQTIPQWEDMGQEQTGSNSGFATLQVNNWSNFTQPAFALASQKPFLEAGRDIEIVQGQNVDLNIVYNGSMNSTFTWNPPLGLDCPDCPEPTASPLETTRYTISITDELGCTVEDSLNILVLTDKLLIPTAFSPNGDGSNDVFRALNPNLQSFTMSVWNRWGEKVFETDDPNQGWNGVFKGKPQDIGVFTYYAEYRFNSENITRNQSGTVTLIR
jgi:gliding motility-associated-like protein